MELKINVDYDDISLIIQDMFMANDDIFSNMDRFYYWEYPKIKYNIKAYNTIVIYAGSSLESKIICSYYKKQRKISNICVLQEKAGDGNFLVCVTYTKRGYAKKAIRKWKNIQY